MNLVEKVNAWIPNRHTMFDKLLKGTFRKLDVIPVDIDADLTKDCIPKFANYYDSLTKTDILLIYNVMNEITTTHNKMVWRNIKFILDVVEQPLLILLAEPSAPNASPRINWLKTQLAQCSNVIHAQGEEEFFFDFEPLQIYFENSGIGLNDRLFGEPLDGGGRPQLFTSIKRTHMACRIEPQSPISMDQVLKQLAALKVRRGKKGYFIGQTKKASPQLTFFDVSSDWGKAQ